MMIYQINKIRAVILFTGLMVTLNVYAQEKGLADRAFATHDVNNVGYFTTNIGQFYPYGGNFEKTLEYPINSGHICMYRQCIMVGVPVNVISAADGRFEEWDALAGFHNPANPEIAISDNPNTWPASGWPIPDDPYYLNAAPRRVSYCAYSDSTNWRYAQNGESDMLLDMRVYQTIYTWDSPFAEKFHIVKFQLENRSAVTLNEIYFNYYSDLDIGGINNEAREWADDCVGFDKDRELVYFYDSDSYSVEWDLADPHLSGITFLKTPNNQGVTDWHWIDVVIDEVAVNSAFWDSVSYYLMRSDTTFFHEHPDLKVEDYFHLGPNPSNGTHFDDPNTSRIEDGDGNIIGGPMVAYICNGPFSIPSGQSVEIIVGVMVGETESDLLQVTDDIRYHFSTDFVELSSIPSPEISATTGNRVVSVSWSDSLDQELSGLKRYKIYKSTDLVELKEESWILLDSLETDPPPSGGIYAYTDEENVYNGFNYIYCVTSVVENLSGGTSESAKLKSVENIANTPNAIMIKPSTQPISSSGDLNLIKVVPNPFIISAPWDTDRIGGTVYGEPVRNIAFTHLPSRCTIKIYTVDGDHVQTINHDTDTGREEWDLLSSEKRPIVSGIYFYHIKSDLGEKVGRFAVIR